MRMDEIKGGVSLVSKISSDSGESHFIISFIQLGDGRISRLDEYGSECTESPKWRKDMGIGRPIK